VLALAERYKPDVVLIEDASTGTALAQDLREAHCYRVELVPVEHDKVARLYVQQAKFAAGRVWFPRGVSFLPALEDELLTFPQSKYDDQVDSISQALSYEPSGYDSTLRWVSDD
jgi:predicted phage terminase large subunit-like protein